MNKPTPPPRPTPRPSAGRKIDYGTHPSAGLGYMAIALLIIIVALIIQQGYLGYKEGTSERSKQENTHE